MDSEDITHELAEDQRPEEPLPTDTEAAPEDSESEADSDLAADSESEADFYELSEEFGDIKVNVSIPKDFAKELFEMALKFKLEHGRDILISAENTKARPPKRPKLDPSMFAENEDTDEEVDDDIEGLGRGSDVSKKRPAPKTQTKDKDKSKIKKTATPKKEISPKKQEKRRITRSHNK